MSDVSKQNNNVINFKKEITYLILFALTLILILWQSLGMNKSIVIHPNSDTPLVFKHMDDFVDGGRIVGTSQLNKDGNLLIDCPITELGSEFYFCSTIISLTDDTRGIDLTRFETITIDFDFSSDVIDTILFYLVHYPVDNSSYTFENKVNINATLPIQGYQSVTLNIEDFYVPSWWMVSNSGDSSGFKPEFHNVRELQISTGDSRQVRNEHILIKGIRFDGKWIRSSELNIGIIFAWVLISLYRIIKSYSKLRYRLRLNKNKMRDLEQLNGLLNIEKEKFETMAKKDELTQLHNRSGAREILYDVQQEYRNNQQTSALIMIDIDDFKQINDNYGHNVGDIVLKDLAELLSNNVRHNDHVIRWGGEEFIIICEHTDMLNAKNLAEKLRRLIEKSEYINGLKITCSFGIAELCSVVTEEWFKQADDMLYEAKRLGKNRVVIN